MTLEGDAVPIGKATEAESHAKVTSTVGGIQRDALLTPSRTDNNFRTAQVLTYPGGLSRTGPLIRHVLSRGLSGQSMVSLE